MADMRINMDNGQSINIPGQQIDRIREGDQNLGGFVDRIAGAGQEYQDNLAAQREQINGQVESQANRAGYDAETAYRNNAQQETRSAYDQTREQDTYSAFGSGQNGGSAAQIRTANVFGSYQARQMADEMAALTAGDQARGQIYAQESMLNGAADVAMGMGYQNETNLFNLYNQTKFQGPDPMSVYLDDLFGQAQQEAALYGEGIDPRSIF
jgi:hypothetical protein